MGEIWTLSGPPHEGLVLNGPLAGRWLTDVVGDYQQRLLGEGVEMDPREPFPFLIKFVLASRSLPVHVHPHDNLTLERRLPMVGVDKVWVVLDSEPGGLLYLGFRDSLSRDGWMQAARDGSLPLLLNALPVAPGDVYTVPAGRAHALGRGIRLLEIRRHSIAGYEISCGAGMGEEGLAEAFEALERHPVSPRPISKIPLPLGESRVEYVACTPRFLLRRLVIKGTLEVPHTGKRMCAYTGLRGAGWLRWGFTEITCYLQPYQTVLVPPVEQDLTFESDGALEVMETGIADRTGEVFGPLRRLGIPGERLALLGGDDYAGILRDSLCGD
jgi:mannose-6-phosphate isomerase class I